MEVMNNIDIECADAMRSTNNRRINPKRAVLLTAFIAMLMFITTIVNIVCTFIMDLATNNEFMNQITTLISQLKVVVKRSIVEKIE